MKTILILSLTLGAAALFAETQPVVGVINWDCSVPGTTYFGHYSTTSLSPAKYRDRTPYYALVKGENTIDYPVRTQADYDRELQFAIDAGIDYFAYCWYGPTKDKHLPPLVTGEAKCCDDAMWEISQGWRLHRQSALKSQIKACAILVTVHPLLDSELESLAQDMKEPWYQQACGKPLLYLYGGMKTDTNALARVKASCAKVGTPEPYVVRMGFGKGSAAEAQGVDALSAYNDGRSGVKTFAALTAYGITNNLGRASHGKPIIPVFTLGWDPSPRLDHPVPWYTGYPRADYAKTATREEWLTGFSTFLATLKTLPAALPTGHMLFFAWNEFEEGGWICPTWTQEGPDTSRIETFRALAKAWRTN